MTQIIWSVELLHYYKDHNKGKGKGAGFKSWFQAGSHDFTILKLLRLFAVVVDTCCEILFLDITNISNAKSIIKHTS